MKAPIGSVVKLYVDCVARVNPGDAIRTTTGRLYLVLEARRQMRGQYRGRQHLQALVSTSVPDTSRIFDIEWYPRG